MKKIMITLALACGIFTAASAAKNEKPWANGKLQVSANQRFLQFENGQPFFMLGDTGWLLPERLDRAEAQYYLQKCRVAGFNTVLIQVMDGTPSFNIYAPCRMGFVKGRPCRCLQLLGSSRLHHQTCRDERHLHRHGNHLGFSGKGREYQCTAG